MNWMLVRVDQVQKAEMNALGRMGQHQHHPNPFSQFILKHKSKQQKLLLTVHSLPHRHPPPTPAPLHKHTFKKNYLCTLCSLPCLLFLLWPAPVWLHPLPFCWNRSCPGPGDSSYSSCGSIGTVHHFLLLKLSWILWSHALLVFTTPPWSCLLSLPTLPLVSAPFMLLCPGSSFLTCLYSLPRLSHSIS